MKVTKSVTKHSSIEVDPNFDLIPGVAYTAAAVLVGRNWYNQKGYLETKESFSVDQSQRFTKPADDLEDILDRMVSDGNFQYARLARFSLNWHYDGSKYLLEIDADYGNVPSEFADYFAGENDQDLIETLYLDWED